MNRMTPAARRGSSNGSSGPDRGAGLVEYAALVVLVLAILVGLIAAGVPAQIGNNTGDRICRIFGGDCGSVQAGASNPNNPNNPAGPAGSNRDLVAQVGGDFDYQADGDLGDYYGAAPGDGVPPLNLADANPLARYLGQFVNAIWTDIVGLGGLAKDLVTDPGKVWQSIKSIKEDPLGFLRRIIVDDETLDMIETGDIAGALGRLTWTIGSLLLPASKLALPGKLARVGRLGSGAEKALEAARKAARAGDALAAKRAAELARRAGEAAGELSRQEKLTRAAQRAGRIVEAAQDLHDQLRKEGRIPGRELPPADASALEAKRGTFQNQYPADYDAFLKDAAHRRSDGTYSTQPGRHQEARTALDLREKGIFPPDVERAPTPDADFQTPGGQTRWDIKEINDRYPGSYKPADIEAGMEKEIGQDIKVVIDTRNASQATIDEVEQMVERRGWSKDVIWYP